MSTVFLKKESTQITAFLGGFLKNMHILSFFIIILSKTLDFFAKII